MNEMRRPYGRFSDSFQSPSFHTMTAERNYVYKFLSELPAFYIYSGSGRLITLLQNLPLERGLYILPGSAPGGRTTSSFIFELWGAHVR